jgi:uncharacterized protein
VLSAAQFDSLASGYGDPSAIAVLVDGQAAKRRLLIRAILDLIDNGTFIDAPRAVLAQAERRDPEAVAGVLSAPLVGVWALAALRRLDGAAVASKVDGAPDEHAVVARELTLLATAAAVRARLPFGLELSTVDGQLVLPTLGAAVALGPGRVRVTGDGDTVVCAGPAGTVRVAAPFHTARDGWVPLRYLGRAGSVPAAAVDDLDPYRNCYRWPPRDRLSTRELAALRQRWNDGWRMLTERYPDHVRALGYTIRSLVPLHAPGSAGSVSAASRHAFGAIGASLPETAAALVEMVIHEGQHMRLGALLDLVDLFQPDGPAVYYAPWRQDPRPVGALLQGAYAHLGVTDFWRGRRLAVLGPQRAVAEFEFALWRTVTTEAVAELAGCAELTELGARFVAGMAGTLERWHAEPVPELPGRLATDVALTYRVRWALAHRMPPPRTAARLAAAWGHGAACPPPGAATVRPARAAAPCASRLASQARRWLAGDEPPEAPDTPLITGRYAEAAQRYAQAVRDTDDPDAWAGLTVALVHLGDPAGAVLADRPELVRTVCSVETGAQPVDIARWIANA